MSYSCNVHKEDGGNTLIIESGGKIEAKEGATVTGFGGGSYTLPTASVSTKGGVKVGAGLAIADEVLSVGAAANVAASEATDVAGCVTAINAILTALKTAGLMVADEEE